MIPVLFEVIDPSSNDALEDLYHYHNLGMEGTKLDLDMMQNLIQNYLHRGNLLVN